MAKNIVVAYIFWAFGGWFGLHHFYLGRDGQAFIWWALCGGYGGVGLIFDFFRLPRYVREANFDEQYLIELSSRIKSNPTPPFSLYRFLGQVAFGNVLGWITYAAIPVETIGGVSLWWLIIFAPLAAAIGVWVVGNVGREEGSFRSALIGSYLALPFYTMADPKYWWSSVISSLAFRTQIQWTTKPPKSKSMTRRLGTLGACGLLYLCLWSSYLYCNMVIQTEEGETIKFRDSVKNLLKSPMFLELKESVRALWHYYRIHGWKTLWNEIIQKLDPLGERNALKLLDLQKGATQEEITQRWRQLSRQWHPDKFRDRDQKSIAQTKFMEIKEAYDKLSVIHAKRKQKNSQSHPLHEEL